MGKKNDFDIGGFWRSISVQTSREKLKKALSHIENSMSKKTGDKKILEQLHACKVYLNGKIDRIDRENPVSA